jgi:hypothetical protein
MNCSKGSLIQRIRAMPISKNGWATTIPLRSMCFQSNSRLVALQTAATRPRGASPRKSTSAQLLDVCPSAILAHKCSDPISVKSTIGKQHRSRSQAGQQIENKAVVVRLASGQRETDRQPTGIDDCMNLGRQSASRPAHQLFTVTGNAGSVPCARTMGVSIICTAAAWPAVNAFISCSHTPALRQRTKRL